MDNEKIYRKALALEPLTAGEAMKIFRKADGFGSVYGSSAITDKFFVDNKIYKENVNISRCIDPSFTRAYLKGKK